MANGHDQLINGLIQAFPADFLTLVAPEIAVRVDLGAVVFRREEYFTDSPKGGRPRRPDLIAQVPTRRDATRWAATGVEEPEEVMIHVEVEYEYRTTSPPRLYEYEKMLSLRHGLLVETIVVYLHGGPRGVKPQVYKETWLGREKASFHYESLGLSGASAAEFLARPEPLAWALAALTSPRSVGSLAELRVACLRRIVGAEDLDENQRFLLFNFVASYIESEVGMADEYEALFKEQDNREVQEAMMTWAEKIEAKGQQAGREKGMRELVLHQLTKRYGRLAPAVERRISEISSPQELLRLAEQMLEADSLEALGLA